MFYNNRKKKANLENIKKCLDLLSEEQRMVVLAYYYDQMGVIEIADVLGISEGAVKNRLCLARKRLMKLLEVKGDKREYKNFIACIPELLEVLNDIMEADEGITAEQITDCYRNTYNELSQRL